jgi:hypothetical protein
MESRTSIGHVGIGLGGSGSWDSGGRTPNSSVPSNPVTQPLQIIAYGVIILR